MIRRIAIAITSLVGALAAPSLPAQSGFGIVGGFISSSATIDPPASPRTVAGSRSGFAIGATYAVALSGHLQFAPELMYIAKGGTQTHSAADITSVVDTKLNYVEAPLLLRYAAGVSGPIGLIVTAGPTIAILASCTVSYAFLPIVPVSEYPCNDPNDPKSGYKSADFGLMFGVGIRLKRIMVTARYEAGLTNVSRNDSSYISGDIRNIANTATNHAILVIIAVGLGR